MNDLEGVEAKAGNSVCKILPTFVVDADIKGLCAL